jgi:hypothetical protein
LLPWIIFAAIIWFFILIFLRSEVKRLWSVAFWGLLVGYLINIVFVENGFYLFKDAYLFVEGIPIGYLIGLAGIGVIMMRFLPEEKIWQLPYLFFFSALLIGIDYLALNLGYLLYQNWPLYYSFLFKLLSFIALTWLSGLTITKRSRNYYFR